MNSLNNKEVENNFSFEAGDNFYLQEKDKFELNKKVSLIEVHAQEKDNTIKMKRNFYEQCLRQSVIVFNICIIGIVIGFVLIFILLLFNYSDYENIKIIMIFFSVIQIIFFFMLRMSNNTIKNMNNFFDKLEADSNKIKAIDLIKEIENKDRKEELSIKLSLFLVGIDEQKICKNSKDICQILENEN